MEQQHPEAQDDEKTDITVAVIDYSEQARRAVMEWNITHPESAAVLEDYTDSERYTADEVTVSWERFSADLAAGKMPDVIFCSEKHFRLLEEQGVTADLSDSLSDLLVSVDMWYRHPDGGLYGVPLSVTVSCIYSETGMPTVMTLDDFLTMAEERDMLSLGQINGYRLTTFLAPLTGCFVDYAANSCDFQKETFLGLLAYLKNTPPVEEEKAAYHLGMLSIESILENKAQIGEGRFTVGGYPDGLENSYHMSASSMIVLTEITSETSEFLQFLLSEAVQPSSIDDGRFLDACLPVTKQALASLLADAETREYYWRKTDTNIITGGNSDIYIVPSSPDEKQIINRKGVPVSFTDEDTALLTAVLDAPFSGSFRSAMPDEIREILYEEFSAYVAADMTAKDCARNIQSRVALYLAERS